MTRAATFAAVLAAAYLVGSFIAWDLNPGTWDILGRGVALVTGIGVATLCTMLWEA